MVERQASARTWPLDRPELTPLLPLVLSVWSDDVISPEELARLDARLVGNGKLSPEARSELAPWLDPDRPPAPAELRHLEEIVGEAGLEDDPQAVRSVSDLGLALWRARGSAPCCWTDPSAVAELHGLEADLGILGAEAARRMVGAPPLPPRVPRPDVGVDVSLARAFLERDHAELRARTRQLLVRPEMQIEPGLPTEPYRQRVLEVVRFLADEGLGGLGFPSAHGGGDDPGGAVAVFETLAFGDLSVLVKYGVQFGLFGGSVLQLGTTRHHDAYLARIATLELPGCYAMTETAHGSNVRDLETTATYDPATDELAVHTPHEGAAKDYIGNAARDGRWATVFARLVVDGHDHGVHALLVPIRTEWGAPMPGVRLEDRGPKLGLNGVDNGRIFFDSLRVPRENLLDRFATLDEHGTYASPIASSGRRFFTMLRTLVAGRVSIASAAISATKVGLTIAVRYANVRRQFGPKGSPERPILDYPLVQRALLPSLATTFALHFGARRLQARYATAAGKDDPELEVEAAGLKAYASEHCLQTLQACREVCGGEGYMAENRFAALKADADIFTTFEGANDVLLQLVAKGLLSRYRDQMGDLNLWRALQYLGERAETSITELNPLATRRTDRDHLLDRDFHRSALIYREERLLRSAATRIRARLEAGTDSFDAVTEVQTHLVRLARAHVERRLLEAFHDAIAAAPSPGLSEAFGSLAALFALSRIEADRGWFLEAGYLEGGKARAVRREVDRACAETRELATPLVAAFGVPEPLLPPLVRKPAAVD